MEPILINPPSTKDLYLLRNADTSECCNLLLMFLTFHLLIFFIILLLSNVFI